MTIYVTLDDIKNCENGKLREYIDRRANGGQGIILYNSVLHGRTIENIDFTGITLFGPISKTRFINCKFGNVVDSVTDSEFIACSFQSLAPSGLSKKREFKMWEKVLSPIHYLLYHESNEQLINPYHAILRYCVMLPITLGMIALAACLDSLLLAIPTELIGAWYFAEIFLAPPVGRPAINMSLCMLQFISFSAVLFTIILPYTTPSPFNAFWMALTSILTLPLSLICCELWNNSISRWWHTRNLDGVKFTNCEMPTIKCFIGEQNQLHSKANVIISNGKHELKARNAEDIWLLPLLMKLARGKQFSADEIISSESARLYRRNESCPSLSDMILLVQSVNDVLCRNFQSGDRGDYRDLTNAASKRLYELINNLDAGINLVRMLKLVHDNDRNRQAIINHLNRYYPNLNQDYTVLANELISNYTYFFAAVPREYVAKMLQECSPENSYNLGLILESNKVFASRTKDTAKHLSSALNKAGVLQKRDGTQNVISAPVAHNIASFLVGDPIVCDINRAQQQEHKSR
jgi:hypothetical protein